MKYIVYKWPALRIRTLDLKQYAYVLKASSVLQTFCFLSA